MTFLCLVWLPRVYISPFGWTFKYVWGFFFASSLTNKKQQSTLLEFERCWQPYLRWNWVFLSNIREFWLLVYLLPSFNSSLEFLILSDSPFSFSCLFPFPLFFFLLLSFLLDFLFLSWLGGVGFLSFPFLLFSIWSVLPSWQLSTAICKWLYSSLSIFSLWFWSFVFSCVFFN